MATSFLASRHTSNPSQRSLELRGEAGETAFTHSTIEECSALHADSMQLWLEEEPQEWVTHLRTSEAVHH